MYSTVSASQLHPRNSSVVPSALEPTYPHALANLSGMLSRMGFNLAPISSALFVRKMDSYSGKKMSRSFRAQKILGIERAVTFDAAWVTANRLTTLSTAPYVSEPSLVCSNSIACTVSNAIRLSFGKW